VNQPPSITAPEKAIAEGTNALAGGTPSNRYRGLKTRIVRRLVAYVALAAVAGLLVGLYVGYSVADLPIAMRPNPPSMNQCVADTLNLLGSRNPPNSEILRDARDHCYSLIQAEGTLSDFVLRKLNFLQQYRANGVLMWMVVAVTFSGVLLAGLQLRASFQLAAAAKTPLPGGDSELILKRDQLALRSSVTGLLILLVSFCFFLVFVLYVYRFETLEDRSGSASLSVPALPIGRLGPPPTDNNKP
jgi:hypothetical protein